MIVPREIFSIYFLSCNMTSSALLKYLLCKNKINIVVVYRGGCYGDVIISFISLTLLPKTGSKKLRSPCHHFTIFSLANLILKCL